MNSEVIVWSMSMKNSRCINGLLMNSVNHSDNLCFLFLVSRIDVTIWSYKYSIKSEYQQIIWEADGIYKNYLMLFVWDETHGTRLNSWSHYTQCAICNYICHGSTIKWSIRIGPWREPRLNVSSPYNLRGCLIGWINDQRDGEFTITFMNSRIRRRVQVRMRIRAREIPGAWLRQSVPLCRGATLSLNNSKGIRFIWEVGRAD